MKLGANLDTYGLAVTFAKTKVLTLFYSKP